MCKRRQWTRTHGFTLVELIMVIVLLGILAAVGSNMLSDSFTSTRIVNAGNASEAEARYAMERMAREIREAKKIGSGYCMDPMGSAHLVFDKPNAGSSDATTCATESASVDISFSDSTITLNGAVLTNLVDTNGFALAYYKFDTTKTDGSVVAAASGSDVQLVQISLAVKDSTSGQSITQQMRIALRNSL